MSIRRQIAVLVVLSAVAAALWYGGVPQRLSGALEGGADGGQPGDGAAAQEEGARPVLVRPVRIASDAARVEAVGTAEAVRSVTLFPESTGLVRELRFDAGAVVQAGTPLLQLDADAERLAVESAQVSLAEAARNLERMQRLSGSGAVSTAELDQARTAHALARIELSRAELALRQRMLAAPFTGVIGIPQVDEGDRVTPETPIASLDDRTALTIDFEVPQVYADGVTVGAPVQATSWTATQARVQGTVTAVSSRVDPLARTLLVRARVPNPGDRFRPGMSFSVRLSLAGGRYPAVPSVAVLWERNSAYLWRVSDGTVERLSVRVLKRHDDWVLVDAPLAQGDRIVVEGVQGLRPGMAVNARVQSQPDGVAPPNG